MSPPLTMHGARFGARAANARTCPNHGARCPCLPGGKTLARWCGGGDPLVSMHAVVIPLATGSAPRLARHETRRAIHWHGGHTTTAHWHGWTRALCARARRDHGRRYLADMWLRVRVLPSTGSWWWTWFHLPPDRRGRSYGLVARLPGGRRSIALADVLALPILATDSARSWRPCPGSCSWSARADTAKRRHAANAARRRCKLVCGEACRRRTLGRIFIGSDSPCKWTLFGSVRIGARVPACATRCQCATRACDPSMAPDCQRVLRFRRARKTNH